MWNLGWDTQGTWENLRFTNTVPDMAAENVTGLYRDLENYDVYVSFANAFNVGGVKGQAGTIIRLVYDPIFSTFTAQPFWDAKEAGLVGVMDGFELGR